MDMGPVLIIRSSSRSYSGPLEVLPGLEHSGTSKKNFTGTSPTIAALQPKLKPDLCQNTLYISHPWLKEGVTTGHLGMPVESRNQLADFLYFLRYW